VFNKQFHLRTSRDLLAVPAPWRPLIKIAAAGEETFYRPKHRPQPWKRKPAAGQQQLELFSAVLQIVGKSTPDPDRPLFDLFPEAYTENDAARPSQASQDERSAERT